MRFVQLVIIIAFLNACKTGKETVLSSNNVEHDKNNKVIINSQNSFFTGSSGDSIIFKGENNLVEINNQNAVFDSKNSKDVLIIDGSQNKVTINQINVRDTSLNSRDTLILNGNKKNYAFQAKSEKSLNIDSKETSNELELDSNFDEDLLVHEDQMIYVDELDTLLTAQETFDYFKSKAVKGDFYAYHKLGGHFEYGIGVPKNMINAIECYEIAARNDVMEAQIRLGELYENGKESILKNREKAIYYYTLAAKNGNVMAIEKLKKSF